MSRRDWDYNRTAREAANGQSEGSSVYGEEFKQYLKIGAGIGFTALVLGGTGYGSIKTAEDVKIDFPSLMLEYSEEINEATAYSFDAINSLLG